MIFVLFAATITVAVSAIQAVIVTLNTHVMPTNTTSKIDGGFVPDQPPLLQILSPYLGYLLLLLIADFLVVWRLRRRGPRTTSRS